jgi:hypothetical protein
MSKELYDPKELLRAINKEKNKTKLKIKKIRSKCNHQGKNDKLWIYPTKKDETVCVCKQCRKKIDLGVMVGKDAGAVKKAIKSSGKEFINWIDIAKIQLSPKSDAEALKFLGDVQYSIERSISLLKACVGDGFEVHKKNKGNKKKQSNKKKGVRIRTGARSMGFGK